jgi:hypothetical protein
MAICLSLSSSAQLKLPGTTDFTSEMKKVIRDYPHNYQSMRGSALDENPQHINYECSLPIPGAESVTISRFSADQKEVYSWQAVMLTTEDFETARAKFKSLYARFNNMAVKMDYGVTFYLKGKYIEPTEERGFTSALMRFELPDRITQKFILEVTMQYEFPEWKVKILIYEKERADNEQGETID